VTANDMARSFAGIGPVCFYQVGALECSILVNGEPSSSVLDTGSGISLVNSSFVKQHNISSFDWKGPSVTLVSGQKFELSRACRLKIRILDQHFEELCGVIEHLPVNVLLGNSFLTRTPFLLDFRSLELISSSPRSPVRMPVSATGGLVL